MAKLTLSGLKSAVSTYVAAAKQAGAWSATTNNIYSMLDKVGKIVTINGTYEDKLAILDGDELPFGKTIEEYMVDLTLPTDYSANGTGLGNFAPTVEAVSYSYTLGRKVIATSSPRDNLERAAIDAESAGNMVAQIIQKLYDSEALYKFGLKKQLLGNMATKAASITGCVATIAKPVDTATGEAFIKQVKNDVEEASFANEGHALDNDAVIGAANKEDLVLFITKGIAGAIDVDVNAGSFNANYVNFPVKVVVVDDFGGNTTPYAMLVDTRGVKLHTGYHAIRTQENAEADRMNFFLHSEYTGFISKFTYFKMYKAA